MTEFIRVQGNLDLDTHQTNYFRRAMNDLYPRMFESPLGLSSNGLQIADPYARNCRIAGPHTNDIDPNTEAKFHLDALDFLCSLESSAFDAVIFDPPFSEYQAKRYEHGTANIYTTPGAVKDQMCEVERVLKPGGYLLKFGYNTSRHKGHFDLIRVMVVNHGANHNDTLVSLWRKANHNLGDYS
jgi:hypothetical protein|tara:strand:- start:419 stop:970 length:552 start_codon:yes stop_codon:yes gene_type:complete